jgi:CIC family chloride channel protein
VVISSVTASVVSRLLLGQEAFFHVPAYSIGSHWELLPYAVLGVVGGLVARLFVVVLYRLEDGFDALRIPDMTKPALGGLLLGVLAWLRPGVLGTGHDTIQQALHGELAVTVLLVLAAAKILATSFTLGSGGSGGVFAPTLFIGAMLGGAFGHWVSVAFPDLGAQPGAYALVGMGVVFTGATWASISGILFLFELTRDYDLILPMMVACVAGVLVAKRLGADTVYTRKLLRRGIDLDDRGEVQLADVFVESVMTKDPETVPVDTPLPVLLRQLDASRHSGFPVVDAERRVAGIITSVELIDGMAVGDDGTQFIIAQDVMRPFEPALHPDSTLAEAIDRMRTAGVRRVPVVSRDGSGRLVGILTNHDVVSALARMRKENRP